MRTPRHDNITWQDKVALRLNALRLIDGEPVICETHGGQGDIYAAAYTHVRSGIVFEKDPSKATFLARQRPSWAVYEADCVRALGQGAGRHLTFNLLDLDPYDSCWEAMEAFFGSKRPFADRMVVAVNDGLRHHLRGGGGWHVHVMEPFAERYGNHNLFAHYLQIAEELTGELVAKAGYQTAFFDGYHTGVEKKMTHFLAVLEK